MIINSNTRIAAILKENPGALEAIVSISPRFEKLRNPFLRKLMAGRTTISMAAKIGCCREDDFFRQLTLLGFEIAAAEPRTVKTSKTIPAFMLHLNPGQVTELDVRSFIEAGSDPLNIIMGKVNALQAGSILKIINSFTPEPLVLLLEKKGFDVHVVRINVNLVETYFYKRPATSPGGKIQAESPENWDTLLERFEERVTTIDVRALQMPLPMMKILEALDTLSAGNLLFVYHKRIPVFLLPELALRKLAYRVKQVSNSEVQLLIFDEKFLQDAKIIGQQATGNIGKLALYST
ncbi:MAG: DUF2249 domain-containing protein [Bacteroidota bacterium]